MPKGDKQILKADLEDGYTQISNTLLIATALSKLSGLEVRALLFLWRQTYGWIDKNKKHKKEATISLYEWAKALNTNKVNSHKILKSLESKHVIKKKAIGNSKTIIYSTNTLISEWDCVDKDLLAKQLNVVSEKANNDVSQMTNTLLAESPTPTDTELAIAKENNKENIYKENIYKEEVTATAQDLDILEIFKSLPGWKFNQDEDLPWLQDLIQDYPQATSHVFKALRDYYSEKPANSKGQWKKRIRHWLELQEHFDAGKKYKYIKKYEPTSKEIAEAWTPKLPHEATGDELEESWNPKPPHE